MLNLRGSKETLGAALMSDHGAAAGVATARHEAGAVHPVNFVDFVDKFKHCVDFLCKT